MQENVKKRVREAHHKSPDVIIGKNGITEGVIGEIKTRLERSEIVKVKVLKTGLDAEGVDRREIARRVSDLVEARLMGVRGRTFVLYKPRQLKGEEKGITFNLFKPRGRRG
jgi:RNA-binding protein